MTEAEPRRREGYPVVWPAHPMWEAQQLGWPNHEPHEAWSAAAAERPESRFADSRSHPGFDPGYIVNKEAVRPADEERNAEAERLAKQGDRR